MKCGVAPNNFYITPDGKKEYIPLDPITYNLCIDCKYFDKDINCKECHTCCLFSNFERKGK